MKVIGYARVSSREQAENSHALEQQTARLYSAGAMEVYADVESGSRDERDRFNKVIELVKANAIDEVIVTRLDRLTRSLPTLRSVLDVFQKQGVNLRALDDSIDLSTAAGKFHLNMLGALAEMEVDRLSERVRHGWAHLRERKVAMNPPFGYCKEDDKHKLDHHPFLCLLENQTEMSRAAIAREIVDAFLEKKTLRMCLRVINERYGIQTFAHNQRVGGRVARDMFRFSPGGLRNWITNPVLQGHLSYLRGNDRSKKGRQEIHYNTHPDQRLITEEEARRIWGILEHNRRVRGYGTTAQKYPLSGLVFCAECRSACYSMKGSRGKNMPGYNYYFQCKNWRLRACSQKNMVRMELAEKAVIDALRKRAETLAAIAELPPEQADPPELQALKAELAYYEAAPGNRAAAIVEDLRQQIADFYSRQQIEDQHQSIQRDLLMQVFSNPTYWETLLPDEQQAIYKALVDQVVVRDGKVERVDLKV